MRVLAMLTAALLSVPLLLSSIVLRALTGNQRKRRRRAPTPAGRAAPPSPGGAAREPAALLERGAPPDVKAMRRQLTGVLDAHEGSREVFRYLAHFERRLARAGLKTLDEMSVKRLRRALAQFEAIVTNWSPPHLAELRSRMAVAVSMRDSAGAMWAPQATISKAYAPRRMPMLARGRRDAPTPTDFQGNRQVEIEDDVGISRFEAAVGAWNLSQRQALATLVGPASRQ
jgi:hypothetical protein